MCGRESEGFWGTEIAGLPLTSDGRLLSAPASTDFANETDASLAPSPSLEQWLDPILSNKPLPHRVDGRHGKLYQWEAKSWGVESVNE